MNTTTSHADDDNDNDFEPVTPTAATPVADLATVLEPLARAWKSIPASDEAEKGILSCIFQDPAERLPDCRISLPIESFHFPANRMVYEILLEMLDAGQPIDVATVTHALRERHNLDKVGGPGAVSELFTFIPATAHWYHYKAILEQMLVLRKILKAAAESVAIVQECGRDDVDPDVDGVLATCQEKILALSTGRDSDGFKTWAQIQEEVINDIKDAFDNKGHIPHNRVATGFTSFDRRTGGLEGGQLVIIAGRPAMGKTSLVMNIVENVAVGAVQDQNGYWTKSAHYREFNHPPMPVLVFSLEMSSKSLGRRMIVGGAGVNLNQVKFGLGSKDKGMERGDQGRIADRTRALSDAKIYVVEKPGISIQEARSRARVMKARYGIGLVVVDYLQLMTSTSKKAAGNRSVEIGEISNGLKNMAKELGVPVIALAQLSRKAEERKGNIPQMADLREGGDIEQAADMVCMIHRPPYYDPDYHDETEATLIIAKGRDVSTGEIPLEFIGPTTTFHSKTDSLLSNDPEKRDPGYQSKPSSNANGEMTTHQLAGRKPKSTANRRDNYDDGYDDTLLGND